MNSEFLNTSTMAFIYRTVTVIAGLLIVYLGYRLFRLGVYEKAGDMEAQYGRNKLFLKQAAPGTFFAAFGAIVMSVSVWKGVDLSSQRTQSLPQGNAIALLQSAANVPDDVRGAITKALKGEATTEQEREKVKAWLFDTDSIRIRANNDPENIPLNMRQFMPDSNQKSA